MSYTSANGGLAQMVRLFARTSFDFGFKSCLPKSKFLGYQRKKRAKQVKLKIYLFFNKSNLSFSFSSTRLNKLAKIKL